jgi:type I restriction enzyme S subunit
MLGAQSGTRLVPEGTVLILVRGMTLHNDVPVGLTTRPMTFNQDIRALIPENGVSPEFLAYSLVASKQRLRQFVDTAGYGTGRLASDFLQEFPILLPPTHEQSSITRCLTVWDTAIVQTEKLIEAKRKLKKGLMQQLLTGKRRFKEFVKSKETRRTKYGQLPVDWDLVCIRDIADVNNCSLPNSTDPDYELFYVDLSAVKEGIVDFPHTHIRFGEAPSRARRIVVSGDVIMATVRPNLKGFALADFDTTDTVCSTGFALISPHCKSDSRFIYENLYSDLVSQQIHGLLVGSNYPAINSSDLENMHLFYPTDKDEREQISKVLAGIGNEIQNLNLYLQALQEQKRGLMQKLLTGQIRVKATEEITV